MNRVAQTVQRWAKRMMRDALALWIAARDRRTPWVATLLAALVAAYAFSPIDLIPDVIPVLGLLDDLLLVPLGIALAVRLVPPVLMREFRDAADGRDRPRSRTAAIVVIAMWVVVVIWGGWSVAAKIA